jgi:hypothetical protein
MSGNTAMHENTVPKVCEGDDDFSRTFGTFHAYFQVSPARPHEVE